MLPPENKLHHDKFKFLPAEQSTTVHVGKSLSV